MELRKVTYRDWDFILETRNLCSKGFINQKEITLEEHQAFMELNGKNYCIASVNGQDVGFVGIVCGDVRLAVNPDFSGNGYGAKMIGLFTDELIKTRKRKAVAVIKPENIASLKSFQKAGWVMQPIRFVHPKIQE